MTNTDHAPPPFFKRGPEPVARLTFYLALSLSLLVVDMRFHTLEALRHAVALVTDPLQRASQTPVQVLTNASDYFSTLQTLHADNERLRQANLSSAPELLRLQQLVVENEHLRKLLGVQARESAQAITASILYAHRDPFARRVVVDKGSQANVIAGQPVIDDAGVVGQITRVFPFSAEVTLITDKEQAVPVQIVRNGLRSVVFGLGNGQLELRFMAANADVQEGDELVTSGLDGIYLPGFPVAKVMHIERESAYSFARIVCEPIAGVENHGEVMILSSRAPRQPYPEELVSKPEVVHGDAAAHHAVRRN
jgi:rod shape-determining protein MreC